jgi:hypothetical protein
LLEARFPAAFEFLHPNAVCGSVAYIDDQLDEIVAIYDASLAPMPFDFLRFVTDSAETVDDLEQRVS